MRIIDIDLFISTLCRFVPNIILTVQQNDYIYFLDFLFNFGNNQENIAYTNDTTTDYNKVIIYNNFYCINHKIYSFDTYKKAIIHYLNIFRQNGYDTYIYTSDNILKIFFELLLIQSKSQQGIIIKNEYDRNLSLIKICETLKNNNIFIKQKYNPNSYTYRYNDVKCVIGKSVINDFVYKFIIKYNNKVVYEQIPTKYPTLRDNIVKDRSMIDLTSNSYLHTFKDYIKYIPQSEIVRNIEQQTIQPQINLPNWITGQDNTLKNQPVVKAKLVIKEYYCNIPKIYKQNTRYYINYNRIWLLPINCKIIHDDKRKNENSSRIHFTWSIEPLSDTYTITEKESKPIDNKLLIKWTDNNYYNNSHRNSLRTDINDLLDSNRGNQLYVKFLSNNSKEIGRTNNFIVQGGINDREKYFLGGYVVGHRLKIDTEATINSLLDIDIIKQNTNNSVSQVTPVPDEIYKQIISFVDLYVTNNTKSFTIDLEKNNTNNMINNNQYPISDININTKISDIIGRKKRYEKILEYSIKDLIDVFINKDKIHKIITQFNALKIVTELNIIEFLYLIHLFNL